MSENKKEWLLSVFNVGVLNLCWTNIAENGWGLVEVERETDEWWQDLFFMVVEGKKEVSVFARFSNFFRFFYPFIVYTLEKDVDIKITIK